MWMPMLLWTGCATPPPESVPPPPPEVTALVVQREVTPGQTLTEDDVARGTVPEWLDEAHLGAGVASDLFEATPAMAVGQVAREPLWPGDPLRASRLAPAEAGQQIGAITPRGLRAVDLPLAAVGALEPGAYVDLFAEDGTWLLPAAGVLAVWPERHAVTVVLSPDQVARTVSIAPRHACVRAWTEVTHVDAHGPESDWVVPEGSVALAVADLYPGIPIPEGAVVGADWPDAPAPMTLQAARGSVPRVRILAGEPVRADHLAGPTRGLHALVPADHCAVALPHGGASGWAHAGVFVEVFGLSEAGTAESLVSQALIGQVCSEVAWVMVPRAAVPTVLGALSRGPVRLGARNELDLATLSDDMAALVRRLDPPLHPLLRDPGPPREIEILGRKAPRRP